MVEGLSLDESSPTTYLDELDKFEDQNRFQPPAPPKVGLGETFKRAIKTQLRNGRTAQPFATTMVPHFKF